MSFTRNDAWVVLARLAHLALNRHAIVHQIHRNPKMRGYDAESVEISVTGNHHIGPALNPPGPDEMQQIAEASMLAWADIYQELVAEYGERVRTPAACEALECPTCGAGNQSACVPVHAGERKSGDWVHPSRQAWYETINGRPFEEWRPNPKAVDLARQILEQERSSWGGQYRSAIITKMAEHILAVDRRDRLGIQDNTMELAFRIMENATRGGVLDLPDTD